MVSRVQSAPLRVPKPIKRPNSKFWYVKTKVRIDGKETQIWRSLETELESEARRRAPVVVAQIRSEHHLRSAQERAASASGSLANVYQAHLDWWLKVRKPAAKAGRFYIPEELEGAWSATVDDLLGSPLPSQHGDVREHYEPQREALAKNFIGYVQGTKVPVTSHLDAYLAENSDFSSSIVSRVKMCASTLGQWLSETHGEDNIGRVDGRVADAFVDAHSEGRSISTLNSWISALSSYWNWMVRRHRAPNNPWEKQSRKKVHNDQNADKRAFTDAELLTLINAASVERLRSSIFIGALSGLRMTEIGCLTVADVQDGKINVRESKTKSGVRMIPIHSSLTPLIERLSAGKVLSDYLIDDLPVPQTGQKKRGYSLSRDFRDLQRRIGTYDRKDGRRQSDIDFHSLRRWFATKAERAGCPPHHISAVLGHIEGRTSTLFVYTGDQAQEQLALVVEAVRLPERELGCLSIA